MNDGFKDMANKLHMSNNVLIDKTMNPIHMYDMVDVDGNKIFASLNTYDGFGGSIVESKIERLRGVVVYDYKSFHVCVNMTKSNGYIRPLSSFHDLKIIGVQE